MTQMDLFGGAGELAAARARLFREDGWRRGASCPCCDQFVKLYSRPMRSVIAATLCWLVWRWLDTDDAYVDVQGRAPRWALRGKDYCILLGFGLAEPEPSQTGTGKRGTGRWRPTDDGVNFALGRVAWWSHVKQYNRNYLGLEGRSITVTDALGVDFDYDELMQGPPPEQRRSPE